MKWWDYFIGTVGGILPGVTYITAKFKQEENEEKKRKPGPPKNPFD